MTDTAPQVNGPQDPSATSTSDEEVIAPDLLELLVCPVDHAKLNLVGTTLVCTACGRVYPIEHGIPNMIVNEEA